MLRGVILCVFLALLPAGQSGTSFSWKPATQVFDIERDSVDLVLSTPLPQHWAVTVTASRAQASQGRVAAGSVVLDGPFIERVKNVEVKLAAGVVRMGSVAGERGLAVCVAVPHGTQVRVLQGAIAVGTATPGTVIQDGAVIARNATVCASLPALQSAITR